MSKLINRRRLLIGSGAILSVAFLPGCASFPVIPKRPAPDARAGMSWISYQSGMYLLTVPRVEMGQNITTALHQIACDELGVSPENCKSGSMPRTPLTEFGLLWAVSRSWTLLYL